MSKPSMSKTTSALLVLLLLIAKSSIVTAGPWEDGYAAYQRKDYTLAVEKWRVVAQTGKAEAQSLLGLMYFFGQGVKQDYPQAITWLRLAAAQGEAKAMYKLGAMHENGQGFTQDNVRAAIWYTMAAKQGHPQANDALKLVSAWRKPASSAPIRTVNQYSVPELYRNADSAIARVLWIVGVIRRRIGYPFNLREPVRLDAAFFQHCTGRLSPLRGQRPVVAAIFTCKCNTVGMATHTELIVSRRQ
ncbi:MAG: sel1 repeat family protein [Betaproteobacteria bacterium]|nr:sel1 repeat family protein [Betaproteobacteria bacterium]